VFGDEREIDGGEIAYNWLLVAKCRPRNGYLACQAAKLYEKENKIKTIQFKLKSLFNDGCSGVHVKIDGNEIILKHDRWFPDSLEELEKMDLEEIKKIKEHDLFAIGVDENGVGEPYTYEWYPCE